MTYHDTKMTDERTAEQRATDERMERAIAQKMRFGDYKGRTIGYILTTDPAYLHWLWRGEIVKHNMGVAAAIVIVAEANREKLEKAAERSNMAHNSRVALRR